MANTAIYRTLAESGSGTVCTLSVWFKKTFVGVEKSLWGGWRSSTTRFQIRFKDDDTMDVEYGYSSSWYSLITDRVFRDTGAWMHVVLAVDSTQATPADREKLYINGVQETSFSTENYMPQNYDTLMTASGDEVMIGCSNASGSAGSHQSWWKGDMSWAQFVDGAQLAPTEFGEVDATSGIWKIKTDVYGTPGTTGFCLKMEDRTNLDLDSSSNAFTFSTEGTLTPTYDNPSNNFCTINPLSYHVQASLGSLADANTTFTNVASGHWGCYVPTLGADAGKWYIEGKVASGADISLGVVSMADAGINASTSWYIGQHTTDTGYQNSGDYYVGGASTGGWSTFTSGDIMGMALDLDNRKIYFHKNGVYEGSGDPVAGTNGLTVTADAIMGFAFGAYNNGSWNINYGNGYFGTTAVSTGNQDDAGEGDFEYDVPAGYYTLCTKNIKAYGG